MGDINYAPIINDMTWSYSRVRSFYDCPYKWYLRYIRRFEGKEMFFASYGAFMHKLIEMYLKGEKTQRQLIDLYLLNFKKNVIGCAPSHQIFSNYFMSGLRYLKNLEPLPFNIVDVEKHVVFQIDNIPVVGYIDILAEKDGELYVIDNKSRTLKRRSKRKKKTKTDEELDSYLRQLYLYSIAVEQEYGKTPKSLCFNCFREPLLIEEPYINSEMEGTKNWFVNGVEEITNENEFRPNMEFFKCNHLCDMQDYCEYYGMTKGGR